MVYLLSRSLNALRRADQSQSELLEEFRRILRTVAAPLALLLLLLTALVILSVGI